MKSIILVQSVKRKKKKVDNWNPEYNLQRYRNK